MSAYPIPPKREFILTQHGIARKDEYYWMRERENPEVIQHLTAENEYLEKELSHIKPLQQKLFEEMKGRIEEVDSSVPEKYGDYFYYMRTEANKQYPIYCRKKNLVDAPEEILLDQNRLAEGHKFCSVSAFNISPDQSKLAYSVDLEGAEVYTIYIKDLTNGELFPEKIDRTFGSAYFRIGAEWAGNSSLLYYVSLDEFHRPAKLFRHTLNTDPSQDNLLFDENDDTFSLSLFKTRSEKFIMTYHYNTISQEMRFILTDDPDSELRILQPRRKNLEYYATHHDDFFFVVTNDNARNNRLVKSPIAAPGIENWQEVIPNRADVLLEHIDVFEDHIVLHERKNGVKQLRLSQVDGISNVQYVKFPDPTYDVIVESNFEFNTRKFRIKYSSLITPYSTVDINLDTAEWELLKEENVPSGFDKSQYIVEYLHAETTDGKLIPLSIAYKKGLEKNGKAPTLIYGYGAYGASSEAHFNSNILSILDRGFVFAIAHVRGGAELGRDWYDEGKFLNKKNSFADFVACAEHLIKIGFSSPDKLAIIGSSAGGLLVGASMILRPDLFKAVICKVPFLDVVTSMSDPTIPLTTLEYEEWGNPQNKDGFEYMLSYSPYDNILPVEYPHLLLTTGFNDPRVAYWEPAKFLARLRSLSKGGNPAMLLTNFSTGHAGASGRYDFLEENSLDFAFLIDRLA